MARRELGISASTSSRRSTGAQSDELQLLEWLEETRPKSRVAAGFTYAGYELRDCLRALPLHCVEVHISNIERRGMHSVTAEAAVGYVAGARLASYRHGLDALLAHLDPSRSFA